MEEKALFQLVERTAGPWHGKVWRCEEMTQDDADAVNARIGVMQWERCKPKQDTNPPTTKRTGR